jgi:peptidoglycan/xylan/chitin deacetylase (PgdA/CDA1 family)
VDVNANKILFVSFFIFCFSFSLKISAQINLPDSSDWGNLYVTTWADNRQSAFSFSFDDGFLSQCTNVSDVLNQYNFTATYFVLPPFLTDSLPGIWRYGTWPMFLDMHSQGHEIASHSLNHPDLTQLPVGDTLTPNSIHYELYHSKKMINERTQNNNCISFAYPYAIHNELIDSLTGLYYESAREVGGIPNQKSISGMEWFKLKSYHAEFDTPRTSLADDLDELIDFQNWIAASIGNGYWAINLAHEVVPFEELNALLNQGSYHPISTEWLILLCDWLKEKSDAKEIWIGTIGNVTKYIKERDCHIYNVISSSSLKIEIELTDTLDDEIYNFPLSAFITVPEEWNYVLVEQGSETQLLESFNADSMQLVLADVIPDGGLIELTEYDPNFVIDEDNNPEGLILYQNYPNPFNSNTNIGFKIAEGGFVTLKVYDVLGNEVAYLIKEELPAGEYYFEFNAGNLPSGMYIIRLNSGNNSLARNILLLK